MNNTEINLASGRFHSLPNNRQVRVCFYYYRIPCYTKNTGLISESRILHLYKIMDGAYFENRFYLVTLSMIS